MSKKTALFIMPRSSKDWRGAEAMWITVAGWAAAAKRKYGSAFVFTIDRVAQPEEVIHYPLGNYSATTITKENGRLKWMPNLIKIIVKDILLWYKGTKWKIPESSQWNDEDVQFVWEQHDLFSGPGRKLATTLKVPLVTYVHAPQVWESAKWGVKRYWWGVFLERFIEARALRKSDIIACVSDEVAAKLAQMGIDQRKILVSPMAVDPYLFENTTQRDVIRKEYGLDSKIVIGWTGSFRSFHGLDLLVKAFHIVYHQIPNSRLLMVGDGFESETIKKLVHQLELNNEVIFAGRQSFAQIPKFVSAFDVALVSARSSIGFHYSPLKLREYLAAGKAVIAPNAGEIPIVFKDNFHLLLYEAGDIHDLSQKVLSLLKNSELREMISGNGKQYLRVTGTWDGELDKLIDFKGFRL